MSNFSHLNPLAESILKILADRPATPANLIFVLRCDKPTLGKHLKYLLAEEYVFNSKQPDNRTLLSPDDNYKISVKGENYLAELKFVVVAKKRQFWINIVNAAVSWTALIKAFWNEISAVIQQVAQ